MQNNWIGGNVIVDQRVQHERHMVLKDGRHVIFGRNDLQKYPECNCIQQAAEQGRAPDAAIASGNPK
jgi:hypothetical protein